MDVAARREQLEALLDTLNESLLEAPAYSRAALAREIRATMAELAALPEVKVNPLDNVTDLRARRRAGSKVSKPA